LVRVRPHQYWWRRTHHSKDAVEFRVARFSDINEKIIPYFDKYKLIGEKRKDYEDFKKSSKVTGGKP